MAPGMPIPSWTRSRNGSSSVALSRNVGPAGDGRSVGNNRPRSWMACGRRCAVAGPTVQRTGSRSFPIASASSVSRAVVVVRHAKRCSDTGILLKAVYQAFLDRDAVASWLPPETMTGRVHTFGPREGGVGRCVGRCDRRAQRTRRIVQALLARRLFNTLGL